jgi:hypothetical protein
MIAFVSIVWNESQDKSFRCAIITKVTVWTYLVTAASLQEREQGSGSYFPKESTGRLLFCRSFCIGIRRRLFLAPALWEGRLPD